MSLIGVKNRTRFFGFVVGRCWWTTIIVILLISVLAAGVGQLATVDVGIRNHFDKDDPRLVELERFEDIYAVSDSVLVVVAPPDGTVFTRKALLAVENLTEALWQTPYATRVSSITNELHTEGNAEGLVVEPLVDDAALLDKSELYRIQMIALANQEIAGRFVSRDGRLAGLIVSLALPDEDREQKKVEVVKALYSFVNKQRADNPDIEYHIYGELLLDQTIRQALDEDMSILAPTAFAMMMLVAFAVLRTICGVLGILAMLIAVIASSFGFAGWAGLSFYGESGAAIFVLMAVAVAHSVHVIQGMMKGMRRGLDRKASVVRSMEINARPIFLTSLTTAIGFLSLNFSEMPPFRVMGNIVAFGSICAFIYSVTLFPALLTIMPMRMVAARKSRVKLFDALGNFVTSKRTLLLSVFAVLFVVSTIGVSRIELDDNNLKLLDSNYELRQSADFINRNFSGLDTLEYSLSAGREGGITDIDYLRQVESFANWLRDQPEVSHVTSISNVMKRLNQNLRGGVDDAYRLPKSSDLAAQYLVLYEFSLPVGLDLNNLINFDRSATRMTVVIESMSVREQIEFDDRAWAWLQKNTPEIQTRATGVTIVSAYSVMRNIVKMLIGTFIAMSIVSLVLVFVFKSIRLGLLSLIPNFLPAIIAMGIWGYAVGTISVAASIVTAIAFGIIVDDTIHLLSNYLRSRKEGKTPTEAIIPTFNQVGRPLTVTTLIFALGFLVFGASGLSTNQTLGVLVGIVIVIALAADFLLFPPLLILLDRDGFRLSEPASQAGTPPHSSIGRADTSPEGRWSGG